MGKKDNFHYDILEIIDVLEEGENHNWAKLLTKISWNDKPPVYDIRNFDMSTMDSDNIKMGKGISLSDEGFVRLIKKGLEMGILDQDDIDKIIKKLNSFFDKKRVKRIKVRIKKLKD